MSAFGSDEFAIKILSLYSLAKENGFFLRLNQEEVEELMDIYINVYISSEKLKHYDNVEMTRKLMTAIVSVYKIDKDAMSGSGEMVQLVNSVNYDGKNMYLHFAKISNVKMRRLELGKTQKQIAERMGYGVGTVRDCEKFFCDLRRQPDTLVEKLAKALECEPDMLYDGTIE